MNNELFELCKEVYKQTEWDDDSLWHKTYEDYRPDLDISVPIYTSDYLLEKMQITSGWKHGRFYLECCRDDINGIRWEASYNSLRSDFPTSMGRTPLKALLKLVLALNDAGIKL